MQSHYLIPLRSALRRLRSNLSPSYHIDEAVKQTKAQPQDLFNGMIINLTCKGMHVGHYTAGSPLANQYQKRRVVARWWWRRFFVRRLHALAIIGILYGMGLIIRVLFL